MKAPPSRVDLPMRSIIPQEVESFRAAGWQHAEFGMPRPPRGTAHRAVNIV
jgi:predicted metalloenzyme YecM